jgi:hypothetical protein
MTKQTPTKQSEDMSFEPLPDRIELNDDPEELVLLLNVTAQALRQIASSRTDRKLPVIA